MPFSTASEFAELIVSGRPVMSIHDFTLGGLVPPLNVTPTDHEGGGWVQIYQTKGGKFVKETEWFSAYPEVVAAAIKKAE